ncbi:hypothetical protein AAFF_G00072110 [Aldrovandia affinis]|uniref:Uncharacterized protein n=1 Tax=Aldrovandia affinis TaxID=143900 RepID=A0AAD7WD72_9TELE|nr:hypothetical protein AAFF_G00072110 [Aldrovandia affinis]
MNTEGEKSTEDRNIPVKTSDVYTVDQNLPKRFNNPDCFQGYSKKNTHPFYRTTNQTYGARKPTVHEMPTAFHGDNRRFTDHMLKSGMYRDGCLNTSVDTGKVVRPSNNVEAQDKIQFHISRSCDGSRPPQM